MLIEVVSKLKMPPESEFQNLKWRLKVGFQKQICPYKKVSTSKGPNKSIFKIWNALPNGRFQIPKIWNSPQNALKSEMSVYLGFKIWSIKVVKVSFGDSSGSSNSGN